MGESGEFTMRWEVDEVSKLTDKPRYSPFQHHLHMYWRLQVCTADSETSDCINKLNVCLRCNEERDDLWTCERSTVFTLIHPTDTERNIRVETDKTLSKDSSSWGPFTFIEFQYPLKNSDGFIEDDKIIVEVHTTVKSTKCIRKKQIFDFTKPSAIGDNIALKLDDGVLYVCRVYLMWLSQYFASLFFGDFKEKNLKEIEFKEVTTKDFEELLHAIFPSDRPINADTYLSILTLGDRFQIERASQLAENYLMKTKNVDVGTKLLLAEQFRLKLLRKHSTNTFKSLEEIKEFESTAEFSQMSKSLKISLLERAFELIK